MTYKTYFHPTLIALQQELQHHPALLKQLESQQDQDFEIRFGTIAAYCKVVMDDFYTAQDFIDIAGQLIRILQSKRVSVILPP